MHILLHSLHIFTFVLSPTPRVTWLRKDGELSESRTVKESFNHRLGFLNVSESDGGEYQCIADNTQGKAKHTFMLTVEGVYYSLSNTQSHKNTQTAAWEVN